MEINNKPLITVITVCYNVVNELEKTILSILNQNYDKIEYIVIDGGSKDGTVDVIKKYAGRLAYWVSEPDKGIYDAMNKGIRVAKGEWCVFMNAGDFLFSIPNELLDVSNKVYSALSFPVEENDKVIEYPSYSWTLMLHNTLPHQGLFYNLRKLKIEFDLRFKVFSDYNQNIKMKLNNEPIRICNSIVAFHSMDGISNNSKYGKEIFQVVYSNYGIWGVFLSFIYFKWVGMKKKIRRCFKKIKR